MKALLTIAAAVAAVVLGNHAATLAMRDSAETIFRSANVVALTAGLPKAHDPTLDRGSTTSGKALALAAPAKKPRTSSATVGVDAPWSVAELAVAAAAVKVPIAPQNGIGGGVQYAMFSVFASGPARNGGGFPAAHGGGAGLFAGALDGKANFLTHIAGGLHPQVAATLACLGKHHCGIGGNAGIAPVPIAPALLMFVTGLSVLFGLGSLRRKAAGGAAL